ncbi:hypothetical protein [Anaerolentibacter hominis]|uniref:hypothetical protein n=1 Tax=Anaerolentibacter hominis TaxID=3079009 RepID=UPI0031B81A3E
MIDNRPIEKLEEMKARILDQERVQAEIQVKQQEQDVVLASVQLNTEYLACMSEINA